MARGDQLRVRLNRLRQARADAAKTGDAARGGTASGPMMAGVRPGLTPPMDGAGPRIGTLHIPFQESADRLPLYPPRRAWYNDPVLVGEWRILSQ